MYHSGRVGGKLVLADYHDQQLFEQIIRAPYLFPDELLGDVVGLLISVLRKDE